MDAEPLTGAGGTPWAEAARRLAAAETYWLATVRADGRPHVVPLLGVWVDGSVCIAAGPGTRKAANLARDPRCVVTAASLELPSLDLVVEGSAVRVGDDAVLARVAAAYRSKYGWEVEVRDGSLHGEGAPTAGPPPYAVFAVTPAVVHGFPGVAGSGGSGPAPLPPTRWRAS